MDKNRARFCLNRISENITWMQAWIDKMPEDTPGKMNTDANSIFIDVVTRADWRKVRQLLKDGPAAHHVFNAAGSGANVHVYELSDSPRIKLHLCYTPPTGEGASCRRVQVGEKTEPLYQIVCN